ncbi:DUF2336 domain-containing protein [Azospirillum sp. RWY-5-1]|uniref:DUF2336 domain-containing protein n=1 Tax=Azospirillum oleiclasticum TaxID=2735135 RepID=A0ABX2TGI4_9PROT|nr:DUF2336 domain-containing protein [Azospirillum oleiclasticum]NYZ16730.1 DUF2336 domain-containing protein [Azospirillum oleiclasticum]NYZ23368.1 DUF2336 domain-containing protein [Azospirillum oleiclasticum]
MTTPAPSKSTLSKRDVDRLLATPTAESRIETMGNLVRDLEAGALDETERGLALEVLHCFAADAELAVREAVAWQIHNSPLLTTELAERLVRDVARVAFPILRHAAGLNDRFLLKVLEERDAGKQLAIAGRREVTATISEALVEEGNVAVITCLLRNQGAVLPERTLHRAVARFGRIRAVSDAMASRPGLPLAVVEKLVAYVSAGLRATLVRAHGLAPALVNRLVENAREAATMRLLRPVLRSDVDAELLARWLQANGRLSASLLFRALCAGDVALFTAGLSARAGIPVENARALAWDDGALGLRALFQRAGLPLVLAAPFRVAVTVAKEMVFEGGEERRDAFQSEVIARLFEECTPTDEWAVDDLLLQLFDQKSEAVILSAMEQAGLPFLPVR